MSINTIAKDLVKLDKIHDNLNKMKYIDEKISAQKSRAIQQVQELGILLADKLAQEVNDKNAQQDIFEVQATELEIAKDLDSLQLEYTAEQEEQDKE